MKSPNFMAKDGAYKEISSICRDIAGDSTLTSVGMLVLAHIFQKVDDNVGVLAMIRGIQQEGNDYAQDAALRRKVDLLLGNVLEKE